ncbi:DUF6596 domain-containing protein [Streptomyces avicenniae]|uniref:DUF6596 domain-containing protein n=1 Tax=Streptomyces avicenniae TaxID=500153 RepID=UPI00069AA76E|nr:DUF6596 domain-containing protein [Streptomyces avicenniae]
MTGAADVRHRIGAVWKAESARIVAGLVALVRDVGLAEELAQDALVAALEQWPVQGVPDAPGAWLTAVARRRAVDRLRRGERAERAHEEAGRTPGAAPEAEGDVLRLMFLTCHPALPAGERTALTLRLVGGLSTGEIARAYLLPERTVARRLARARRTLAAQGRALTAEPDGPAGRLASVLDVLYLVFNEGYAATAGDALIRQDLVQEALRLGRLLAGAAPDEPEAHGLLALMEVQASRSAARTAPDGTPVPLHEQDRGLWDRAHIRRGFAAMLRARESGGPPGPYVLQAAIAISHARAPTAAATDWPGIAALYGALERLLPTPVVRLNRAVAVGRAQGPDAGLALVDGLSADPVLRDYHLLPGVRGDLLALAGRHAEARPEFERAARLTRNEAERAFLLRRAARGGPAPAAGRTLGAATDAYLAQAGLRAGTARSYGQTLRRLRLDLGEDRPLTAMTEALVARRFAVAWADVAPRTWNRHRAAVRSFAAWAGAAELAAGIPRRHDDRVRLPPLAPRRLDALTDRPEVALRERTLWRLLAESGAAARAALALDVESLAPGLRGGTATTGAGPVALRWGEGTAALLARLVADRTRGPVFLADRRPVPARMPRPADLCPETGRGRLSYERAAYLCKRATGGTLHQISASGRRRARNPA